jgi:hypothetical protein
LKNIAHEGGYFDEGSSVHERVVASVSSLTVAARR